MSNQQWNNGQGSEWAPQPQNSSNEWAPQKQGASEWTHQVDAQPSAPDWGQAQPQTSAQEWGQAHQPAAQEWGQAPQQDWSQTAQHDWNQGGQDWQSQPSAGQSDWQSQPSAGQSDWQAAAPAAGQDWQHAGQTQDWGQAAPQQDWSQQQAPPAGQDWQAQPAGQWQQQPPLPPAPGPSKPSPFDFGVKQLSLPGAAGLIFTLGVVGLGVEWLFGFVNVIGLTVGGGTLPILNSLLGGLGALLFKVMVLRVLVEVGVALARIMTKQEEAKQD